MRPIAASIIVFFFLAGWTARSQATDADRAKQLFDRGRERLHDAPGEACALFSESFAIDSRVGTLLNLASCTAEEGHLVLAHRLWLESAALARSKADARSDYADSQAEFLARRIPTLAVPYSGAPPKDARVLLDGVLLPPSGLTATPIDPGEHMLVKMRSDGSEESHVVMIREGQAFVVPIHFEPVVVPTLPAIAPSPPVGTGATPPSSARTWMLPAGYGFGAIGAASLAAGAYFGVRAVLDKNEADSNGGCSANICTPAGLALRGNAATAASWSTVAFVVAGLATTAGVVLLALAPAKGARGAGLRSQPTFVVTAHATGAALDGHF